ncbi:hypothetical protein [Clostridium sp. MD294]|uniref:hypothetical protein n=1 Tax=Clostridium sp. MD294 TaxID=97138 RepID=UPI0002CC5581|nr:hypothetical protein [Clostridium sp. MD294]USF29977.1 hypothetical protein C820_001400 [Clostridium sp. MD294]
MKKLVWLLSVVFVILTFLGAGYVLYYNGAVNAGYAVIPMLFALISITYYKKIKK